MSILCSCRLISIPTIEPTPEPTINPTALPSSHPTQQPIFIPSINSTDYPLLTIYSSLQPSTILALELSVKEHISIVPTQQPSPSASEVQMEGESEEEELFRLIVYAMTAGLVICLACLCIILSSRLHAYKRKKVKTVKTTEGIDGIALSPVLKPFNNSSMIQDPYAKILSKYVREDDLMMHDQNNIVTQEPDVDVENKRFVTPRHSIDLQGDTDSVYAETKRLEKQRERLNQLEVLSWLQTTGFSRYYNRFIDNGYEGLEFIKEIDQIEQLIEIGIDDKDQKKILNEILQLSSHIGIIEEIEAEGIDIDIDDDGSKEYKIDHRLTLEGA